MQNHLDYIFFIYGLSFLLMGCMAWSAWENKPPLPWRWLAGFGLLHGANEWLDLLALSFPPSPGFNILRLAVMAGSFALLLEFGLRSLEVRFKKWIYLIALILIGFGGYLEAGHGIDGMSAAARYTLGLPASLIAGLVFWRTGKLHPDKIALRIIGTAFLVYGIATGAIPSPAHFFPANIVNSQTFLDTTGFPVQIIRTLCAVAIAFSLWILHQRDLIKTGWRWKRILHIYSIPSMIVFFVAFGWMMTNWQGKTADAEIRGYLLEQAHEIAGTISPATVKKLSFSAADRDSPHYRELRNQLAAYGNAIGLGNIYTMALRNGQILFGPENIPENDQMASKPGTPYEEPPPEVRLAFSTNEAFIVGPYTDEYGTFISALAPVYDLQEKKVVLVVGSDLLMAQHTHQILLRRLLPIIFTMAITSFLLAAIALFMRKGNKAAQVPGLRLSPKVILVATCGLAITLSIASLAHNKDKITQTTMFRQVANSRATELRHGIKNNLSLQLDSLKAYFESSNFVDRNEFKSFTSGMLSNNMILAFGWVPDVPGSERQKFEEAARQEGLPGFGIFELSGEGKKIPAGRRDMHHPVYYSEPGDETNYALGYDASSSPVRMQAIALAEATGMPVATTPIQIVTGNNAPESIIVYYPVRKPSTTTEDPPRWQNGLIVAALPLQELLDSTLIHANRNDPTAETDFFQLDPNAPPLPLTSFPARFRGEPPAVFPETGETGISEISAIYPLFSFGRAYAIVLKPGKAFLDTHPGRSPWTTIIPGILLTMLIAFITEILSRRDENLEREVELRTLDLIAVNARLESATRAKSNFLAHMSHELRTPLNVIMGFSEILQKSMLGPSSPKYAEYAEDIHSGGTYLLSLINDVIDLSKIEAGKFTLLPEPVDILALVRDCSRLTAQIMEKKELHLHLAMPDTLPRAMADERAIRQVLLNLLSNAIKFTPADGIITISARHDAENHRLWIEVMDTGIGVAPENLEKIFAPFQQENSMIAKKFGGTGLGLAISRDLIRLHGSDMMLQSAPGVGSRFSFTLPVARI